MLIIGAIALILAGIAWFAVSNIVQGGIGAGAANGAVVVCQTRDGFRRVDALSSRTEYTVRTDSSGENGYNTVVIANGSVDVVQANCSNQVCVDHDPISEVGEQIVCLPHGMVVEIVANENDASELVP